MATNTFTQILHWLKHHPGVFLSQEEGKTLKIRELYSQKERALREGEVEGLEEKNNRLNPQENYLVLLLKNGVQLVLSNQGFAFAPDFTNTGPIELPSQVYCLQDFHHLLDKLQHLLLDLASDSSSGKRRHRDALDLTMLLIAILDGAKAVGLNVDTESQKVDLALTQLENLK